MNEFTFNLYSNVYYHLAIYRWEIWTGNTLQQNYDKTNKDCNYFSLAVTIQLDKHEYFNFISLKFSIIYSEEPDQAVSNSLSWKEIQTLSKNILFCKMLYPLLIFKMMVLIEPRLLNNQAGNYQEFFKFTKKISMNILKISPELIANVNSSVLFIRLLKYKL